MTTETLSALFPCPICGRRTDQELFPDSLDGQLPSFGYNFSPHQMKTYRFVLCRSCHHGYASPRPMELWKSYTEVEDPAYLVRQPERLLTAQRVLPRVRRYVPAGRLLDVGCATGDFLSAAQALYEVEGVELSAWAAAIAEQRGLTIYRCRLEHVTPQTSYDVVTLWGVIEHFEDPAREVRAMHRLLRPGGIVALWTGDVDSWLARLLKQRWWYVMGQHLQLFSRQSLRALFVSQGFQELWVGRYPYVATAASITASLSRYRGIGPLMGRLLHLPFIAQRSMTLHIPGEMFAVFRKVS